MGFVLRFIPGDAFSPVRAGTGLKNQHFSEPDDWKLAPLKFGGYIGGPSTPATAQTRFLGCMRGFFESISLVFAHFGSCSSRMCPAMSPQAAYSDDLFGLNLPEGFILRPKQLDLALQTTFLALIREIELAAPLTKVRTKNGGMTSAAMTNGSA